MMYMYFDVCNCDGFIMKYYKYYIMVLLYYGVIILWCYYIMVVLYCDVLMLWWDHDVFKNHPI